jgi:hypothetical protein
MNSYNLNKLADLDEARAALEKLRPHLPLPRLSEQMSAEGLALPKVVEGSAALPVQDQPLALISGLGPLDTGSIPQAWKGAYHASQLRVRRRAQLARLLPGWQLCNPRQLADVDGVVAGLLLLASRPLPGTMRCRLMQRADTHWWGSFFAAHGLVCRGEEEALLAGVAHDPRLAWALSRARPELAAPLIEPALARSDLWSAGLALAHPLAAQWLGRAVAPGSAFALAALTALTLQPSSPGDLKQSWLDRLRAGDPRLACLAARWTRHTWPSTAWHNLRDQLRATAISDRGLGWFHWYRDVENEGLPTALEASDTQVLWQAELIKATHSGGEPLRQRILDRLKRCPADQEARLALRWLDRRHRSCG